MKNINEYSFYVHNTLDIPYAILFIRKFIFDILTNLTNKIELIFVDKFFLNLFYIAF